MSKPDKYFYEFGPYTLLPTQRQLRWHDTPVQVEPKVFETLLALIEHGNELATKEELLHRIWPDTFVEEINLARNISTLRKVLEQGFAGERCIQTVPKFGYRFTAPIYRRDLDSVKNVSALPATDATTEAAKPPASDRSPIVSSLFRQPGRLMYAALGLVLCAGLISFWKPRKTSQATGLHPLKSIAILPFKPLNAASREPHLEIGVADTLITRLSHVGELTVRPTSAIRAYAERNVDAVTVGRELTVDSVLEGSLQREGDRLRTTVRLLRVSDGQPLWAYQCDTACTDIFQTQDMVSLRVAAALRSHLSTAEQQHLTKRGTNDFEAYQLYLKGQHFFSQRNAESFRKAIDCYQQAIARDSKYALAYNGLAMAQKWLLDVSGQDDEVVKNYAANLQTAATLDPALPEAHATLGLLAQNDEWDWAKAEREFQEAIQLNPNFATAHHWYGEHLFLMGRHEAGLRELRRAQEIDPLSLIINSDIAKCYLFARQYDQVIAQARHTLELDPNFIEPHYWLSFAYYLQGRWAEAQAEAQKAQAHDQRLFAQSLSGMTLAAQGQREAARRVLATLHQTAQRRRVEHDFFAYIHLALGEQEQALRYLEQAFAAHEVGMIALRAPIWDSLRNHPRFQALQQRMRFPE
jgi:DNA-binding winged helix-turn-helix (wHTH) protein/TolB-like protein/Tfp pilus assembly protein PilF